MGVYEPPKSCEWIVFCLQLGRFIHVLNKCLLIATLFGKWFRVKVYSLDVIEFMFWWRNLIILEMLIEFFVIYKPYGYWNVWVLKLFEVVLMVFVRILDGIIDISFKIKWKNFETRFHLFNDLRINMNWFWKCFVACFMNLDWK